MSVILDILDCIYEHKEIDLEDMIKLLSHWRSSTIMKHLPELRRRGYIYVKYKGDREIICKGVKLA